jgi:hypothetical protein
LLSFLPAKASSGCHYYKVFRFYKLCLKPALPVYIPIDIGSEESFDTCQSQCYIGLRTSRQPYRSRKGTPLPGI